MGFSIPENGWKTTLLAGFAHAQGYLASSKAGGITKRIGWHTFRRSLATLLIDVGAPVKLTQEIMRHSNARVTLELYQRVSMGAKQELQAKVLKSWNVSV